MIPMLLAMHMQQLLLLPLLIICLAAKHLHISSSIHICKCCK